MSMLDVQEVSVRFGGIVALDGVSNVLEDGAILQAECAQGAMFGFDGKSLIHPAQIGAANRAFGADEERLAWARAVVAAFTLPENADKGAIRVGGEMVERLHLAEAKRLMSL